MNLLLEFMVMIMNKKDLIKLIIKFILICLLICFTYLEIDYKKTIKNKAKNVEIGPSIYADNIDNVYNTEYEVDGIIFREISYLYDYNTGSTFNIKIINNSSETFYLNGFSINIYDSKDEVLTKVDIDLKADIGPGDSIRYSYDVLGDVIGTQKYKVKYELN